MAKQKKEKGCASDFAIESRGRHENKGGMPISNEYDVVKFVGSIHSPIRKDKVVSEDMKLAMFSEKEQEFIEEQIETANIVRRLFSVYGESCANRLFSFLTNRIQMKAVLKVNHKDNFLVKSFLRRQEEEPEKEETIKIEQKEKKEKEDNMD